MDFLKLNDKKVLIFGVANRKSVAFHIANVLREAGAELIFSVQLPEHSQVVRKNFPDASVYLCDLSKDDDVIALADAIKREHGPVYGIVHSVAFANFAAGIKPFHEVTKKDFFNRNTPVPARAALRSPTSTNSLL